MTLESVRRYDPHGVEARDGQAVVIGGSVAGLVTARVLADAFESVTVFEADDYPDEPTPRRGVPQSGHIHTLLEAGRATLEDLFPGFGEDLVAAGGLQIDGATDLEFYTEGDFLAEGPRRVPFYSASRPLFEHVIRSRVAALDGVQVRSGCRVTDYAVDDETAGDGAETAVEGVVLAEAGAGETRLPADLVVDATGRTSRTPAWLERQGFEAPRVEEVRIGVGYSTTAIRRPPANRRAVLALAEPPHTRGGAAFPIEGDRWLVNLHGVHGDHPPADRDGFLDFAETLPISDVADLVETHEFVWEEIDRYPFPSNRRHYYEDLGRFPDGLLVVGDAVASFNPIYAQGMSVAALEALVLHHGLASSGGEVEPRRFFERIAPVVDTAWTMAVGADGQFPGTTDPTPRSADVFARYLSRLTRKAHTDGELSEALLRVIGMEKSPASLFRLGILGRALKPSLTGSSESPATAATADSRRPS